MKNKTFTTRRADVSFTYGRNQNIVRHQVKGLGTISQGVIVGLLVLIVGLIYVAQGTEATSYDYRLSEINEEIAALEDEKEDLALEKAASHLASFGGEQRGGGQYAGRGGQWVCQRVAERLIWYVSPHKLAS